jgi:hypothetical protein
VRPKLWVPKTEYDESKAGELSTTLEVCPVAANTTQALGETDKKRRTSDEEETKQVDETQRKEGEGGGGGGGGGVFAERCMRLAKRQPHLVGPS